MSRWLWHLCSYTSSQGSSHVGAGQLHSEGPPAGLSGPEILLGCAWCPGTQAPLGPCPLSSCLALALIAPAACSQGLASWVPCAVVALHLPRNQSVGAPPAGLSSGERRVPWLGHTSPRRALTLSPGSRGLLVSFGLLPVECQPWRTRGLILHLSLLPSPVCCPRSNSSLPVAGPTGSPASSTFLPPCPGARAGQGQKEGQASPVRGTQGPS